MERVSNYLKEKLEKGEKLHFTLIDPAKNVDHSELEKVALRLHEAGTDAFLVGGSLGVAPEEAGEVSSTLKKATGLPVIIFPGNINCLTPKADAVLFMVLMNSLEPYYLVQAQVQAAPLVRKYGLEALPTGYLVLYGETAVAHVGRIQPIPPEKPEIGLAYALAAEMMGFRYIYLEAGSGASRHVPETFPSLIKRSTSLTVIVGGGVRSPEVARSLAKAGADIIVTGTVVEEDYEKAVSIIRGIKSR
ncbi:geranylgeranylglyceryl/heptaprenylglyceryl phosphate synthase [Thermogladius sp. KZ2Tp1]|uniref:geranylgeranylglyceryl/heptaprenylglyceryl phosphate synthase n=1 Tax=Thermogladius sp. KZ2Tp1 TaxID=3136289 RepID=UPI003DA86E52